MKKNTLFFILFLSFVQFINAQQPTVKYTVGKGETMTQIAQKHQLTPYDIIKLNPDAVKGIRENDVLILPNPLDNPTLKINSKKEVAAPQEPTSLAQNSTSVVHIVQPKETKFGIAKRYGVTIQQLELQNPQISAMLQIGQKLQIKATNTVPTEKSTPVINKVNEQKNESVLVTAENDDYIVQKGETLYGIAKKNNISVGDLTKLNSKLLTGVLRAGQRLILPSIVSAEKTSKKISVTETAPKVELSKINTPTENSISASSINNSSTYTVLAGDTKYGLSKRYAISINQLENLNPQIVKGLLSGQKIYLPSNGAEKKFIKPEKNVQLVDNSKDEKTKSIDEVKKTNEKELVDKTNFSTESFQEYEIQAKETLYGLAKIAGLKEQELVTINPVLASGVQVGMVIKMPKSAKLPAKSSIEKTTVVNSNSVAENKTILKSNAKPSELTKALNKSVKKQVTFILPFTQLKYDEYRWSSSNFENVQDIFLKDNLEYYSGAIKAIDSIKSLGLNLDVNLVELDELYTEKKIDSISKNSSLQVANAIILPFYDNVLASLSTKVKSIPILTNQAVEGIKGVTNLFQVTPTLTDIKSTILNVLKANNGNIVVLNDPSRKESKSFISEQAPNAKFVAISNKGVLDIDDLRKSLIKGKKNYVIVDSYKNGMLISATNVLLKQVSDFDIQLVVLEPSLVPNYEKISSVRINILKMIYPSLVSIEKDQVLNEVVYKFKDGKNIVVNQPILNGFEITFDSLLRLFQEKDFEASVNDDATTYSTIKFEYVKNADGNYINKGFYILQHDTDNKIKEIKY